MTQHAHLKRLTKVWARNPVFFVTVCAAFRRHVFANEAVHQIFRDEWSGFRERHGWAVGRYVVMPDHVHFFVAPLQDAPKPLAHVVGKWKEWTAKRLVDSCGYTGPVWQREFFDHLLRSSESRSEKWAYVRENPVRANLVSAPDAWPFAGSVDFE